MPADWTGIERHGSGWRAVVSQGRGRPRIRKTFPPETSPGDMQKWRKDTAANYRVAPKPRARGGTFAVDALKYLDAVAAMPSYKDRSRHIGLWMDVFAETPRDRITPAEIRAQCDTWLKESNLSAHTINLRLRAIRNLYTVLDGKHKYNPAAEVKEYPETDTPAKDLDYATIQKLIDAMPNWGRMAKGEKRTDTIAATKIRVRILAFTGLPAKGLARLTPDDVDEDRARMRLAGRKKGAGRAGSWLPLLPQAVEAFREFRAQNLWGPFSTSSMWKSFDAAANKIGLTGASPYSLRHSFLTLVYDVTGSLEAVMAFGQHASASMSKRYTQRVAERVLAGHLQRVGQHLGATWGDEKGVFREVTGDSPGKPKARPKGQKRRK